MTTLAAQVTATGIVAPDYATVLAQLQNAYRSIYGSDVDLAADTQDGQFLAILAQAIYDTNQMSVAVYNSFAPSYAQGAGLSALVKINGIARLIASNSQVVVTLVGVVGTLIERGQVGDDLGLGTVWNLPDSVVIPLAGTIDVTALCSVEGAVPAAAGSLTRILTPTRGWQSSTNAADAVLGLPVESDYALRARQTLSVALPALTTLESVYAGIAALTGVSRLKVYENDTDATDGDGVPAHSIAPVVEGGDVQDIAGVINDKKSPGCGTYGTTTEVVVDSNGVPNAIHFFVLTVVPVRVEIHITALEGYVSTTGDALKQAVADFISGLDIGEDSYLSRLYSPANLGGTGLGATFVVTLIEQARDSDPLAAANIVMAFNEAASCVIDDIDLVVT